MNEKRTLTVSLFKKLQKELEYLKGEGRIRLSRSIESSREEGDLKENSGYDSLQEEQSQHEMRIQELKEILRNSELIDSDTKPAVVKPGFLVKVEMANSTMQINLYIGHRLSELYRSKSNSKNILVCSQSSPAGKALIGRQIGDTVSYTNPGNKPVTVKILDIDIYDQN